MNCLDVLAKVYHLGRWWVDKALTNRLTAWWLVYHLGRWWVDKAMTLTVPGSG